MSNQTKHTIESVVADLRSEFKDLSTKDWEECGDVNLLEYGGVKYQRVGDVIGVQFFRGIEDLPEGIEDRLDTTVNLEELLRGVGDIWDFADVGNCGLNIGWAISSLNSYNGFLSNEGGWYSSESDD